MAQPSNEIEVYQPDETMRLDVRLENDTVWLAQEQMSHLFGRTQPVIARHIGNIFKEGELDRKVVYTKTAYTARHGAMADKTQIKEVGLCNIDVVISVGYRVKSVQGTRFRQWATKVLKEYMLRGYAFHERVSQLEDKVNRRVTKTEAEVAVLQEKVDFFVKTALKIKATGISSFNSQYGGLTLRETRSFRDRFLMIDGSRLYHVGASLKDLGRKCFAIASLDASLIHPILAHM